GVFHGRQFSGSSALFASQSRTNKCSGRRNLLQPGVPMNHSVDLIRNFTVFQQVDGKTRKVVARYQQFRAIHKAVGRLQEGRTMTILRKEKKPGKHEAIVEKEVTFSENIRFEEILAENGKDYLLFGSSV